jgi:hypothetical protein
MTHLHRNSLSSNVRRNGQQRRLDLPPEIFVTDKERITVRERETKTLGEGNKNQRDALEIFSMALYA